MATIDEVKIRMYRHGFGDCFLLQFFDGTERMQTMLIDCGLKLNDQVPGITMANVRDDIEKQLKAGDSGAGKPKLDILVVTHEHWDHVSAFHPDDKLYDHFSIGKIWLAWTENPDDDDAKVLNKGLKKRIKALAIAAENLKKKKTEHVKFFAQFAGGDAILAAREGFNAGLQEVLGFYGPLGVKKTTPGGINVKEKYTISLDTQMAMDHIRSLAKGNAGIRYCNPGELIEDKNHLPGVKIFVLGPPKNKLLTKDAPSKANSEVYFGDTSSVAGLVDGLLAMGDPDTLVDESRPFGNIPSLTEHEAKKHPYYKEKYYSRQEAWRTVEDDWLDMAGALAMQMDSDTNNTSLALAIQLPGEKVLLFPGDAQVGNWLSWHDLEWKVKTGTKTETVNATTLLNNTVVYKVGHHASHNATLKELGLELMISEDLIALVPEKEKQYNGIPYNPLVKKLREKTKGRMIFSADSNYKAEKVIQQKPAGLSEQEWNDFKKKLKIDKLFIEYTLKV